MTAKFDTVIEIDDQRHVIHDTNLYALHECPTIIYSERLDQNLFLGWKHYPGNHHIMAVYPKKKE